MICFQVWFILAWLREFKFNGYKHDMGLLIFEVYHSTKERQHSFHILKAFFFRHSSELLSYQKLCCLWIFVPMWGSVRRTHYTENSRQNKTAYPNPAAKICMWSGLSANQNLKPMLGKIVCYYRNFITQSLKKLEACLGFSIGEFILPFIMKYHRFGRPISFLTTFLSLVLPPSDHSVGGRRAFVFGQWSRVFEAKDVFKCSYMLLLRKFSCLPILPSQFLFQGQAEELQ